MATNKAIREVGTYSLKGGFRIDGAVSQFWATKAQAKVAAKLIGWPVKSVVPVYTRFQMGFGLLHTFGGIVTREEFARFSEGRSLGDGA